MTPWFPQSDVLSCHGYFLRVSLSFPSLPSPSRSLFLCASLWWRGGPLDSSYLCPSPPTTYSKKSVSAGCASGGCTLLCHLVLKEPLLDIPGGPMVRDPPTCGIQEDPTHREQPSSYNASTEPAHLESVLGSKSHHHEEKRAHRNQRKPEHSAEDPVQPKINKYILKSHCFHYCGPISIPEALFPPPPTPSIPLRFTLPPSAPRAPGRST